MWVTKEKGRRLGVDQRRVLFKERKVLKERNLNKVKIFMKLFVKQLQNKNYGEVYMHVVCNYIAHNFMASGRIEGIDYMLDADNFDGVVIVRLQCHDDAMRIIEKIDKRKIEEKDVRRAVGQMECVHRRCIKVDWRELTSVLNGYRRMDWEDLADLEITKPVEKGAWSLRAPFIEILEEVRGRDFVVCDIYYTVNQPDFRLKSLTAVIMWYLNLAVNAKLYFSEEKPFVAQLDYFWAEYQYEKESDLVGIQQPVVLKLGTEIKAKIDKIVDELEKLNFSDKLFKKLKKSGCELGVVEIFRGSGQIVGNEYWKNITKEEFDEIYRKIIENIEVTCV